MSLSSWLFGPNSLFGKLFGGGKKPAPVVVVPVVVTPLFPVATVVFGQDHKVLVGATVELKGYGTQLTNGDGYAIWPTVKDLSCVFTVKAVGYADYSANVVLTGQGVTLMPGLSPQVASTAGPNTMALPALTPLTPPTPVWNKAQLMDMQGDLMVWCPALKLTYVNGVDAETGIKEVADNGGHARGIENGWVWSLWIQWYPAAKRQIFYDEVKRQGFTHVAIQVCEQRAGDTGYHGLRPISQADSDGYGTLMNTVHAELVANGIIPVVAGVAPGPAASGGAALANGFTASQVLVAMTDWDNTTWAAERIKLIGDTFPNALLYYERPGNKTQAQPDASPSGVDAAFAPTATNGGAWIRAMQMQYPNFVGVLYEVNNPDGLAVCAAEITLANGWWRDLQQVQFEIDTYWKFWENLDKGAADTFNVALKAHCSQLNGFMSGGATHTPLVSTPVSTNVGGSAVDQIDVTTITFVGGPNIGAWPMTAQITKLEIQATDVYVEFTKQDGPDSWPDGITPGWAGPLQFSLGICLNINSKWYASAPIEIWRGKRTGGGPIQSQAMMPNGIAGQINGNWFYNNTWTPMNAHQPKPGELIGFFVCAGDARNNFNPVQERSNIVTFPLPADGQTAAFTYTV